MKIPFGQFAPDMAPYSQQAIEVAKNVIPQADGYAPMPSLQPYSGLLPDDPQGFFFAESLEGAIEIFAATVNGLYILNKTTLDWDNISRATAYTGDIICGWSMAQFGDRVIAVNQNDEPQYYDIGASTEFDDLPGSPPKARRVTTVGDFVVLYALTDALNAVRWSGINDSETWTLTKNSADMQSFPDGGEVLFVGSEGHGATVIQRRKIRTMTFLPGSPLVFQFDVTAGSRGAVSARSCVHVGSITYMLSDDGFYQVGPDGSTAPIGAQFVDRFFLTAVDQASIPNVQAAVDVVRKCVFWRYSETTSTTTDKALCYQWDLGRWSQIDGVVLSWFGNTQTVGLTLGKLDDIYGNLDAIPLSLDSPAFVGGRPVFAGFCGQCRLSFFDGGNLEATIETADLQLVPEREAFVAQFRPIVDATTVYGAVATRAGYSSPNTWRAESQMRSSGRIAANKRGYTHRFRLRIPADAVWDTIQGVDLTGVSAEGSI